MNEKKFKETALKHVPKKHRLKNAISAFISGGVIALVGQGLIDLYMTMLSMEQKTAATLMTVTIIFAASLLTGLGLYDKLAQKFGAGMFIPITGFANSLASSALEGKSEGPIFGVGSNMFKLAGSVLTYGIVSAAIFGAIRFLLFGA